MPEIAVLVVHLLTNCNYLEPERVIIPVIIVGRFSPKCSNSVHFLVTGFCRPKM